MVDMLAPTVGVEPALLKPKADKKSAQFAQISPDSSTAAQTPDATTTDNTPINTQSQSTEEPQQQFCATPHKEVAAQTSQENQPDKKSEEQDRISELLNGNNPVQPALSKESIAVRLVLVKEISTPIGNVYQQQTKTNSSNESAQLITASKNGKSAPVVGNAVNADGIKNLISVAEKAQPDIKTILPESSTGEVGIKTASSDALNGVLATAIQPGEGKNVAKVQISNNTSVVSESPLKAQNGKELIPESPTENSTTDTTGEKPVITGDSAVSSAKKPLILNDGLPTENSTKDTTSGKPPILNDSLPPENSAKDTTGGKPLILNNSLPTENSTKDTTGEKPPILNDSLPIVDGKSSNSPQMTVDGLIKSPLTAEKPTNNETYTAQQNQVLSESADGNTQEQPLNSSGESILKSLNPQQVLVSTNQTKGDGNSFSNNNGSKQDFKQVLSANSAQHPVGEQTSVSTPTGKAANNASTSDMSASISRQIQESIQNSLHQTDKQVTINLNPPELGKVSIKFQEQDGQITGLLEVDKAQTRYEIERALPEIIRNLTDSGVQIKRVEVVLNEQSEQQPFKDQSVAAGKEGTAGQQDSTNPGSQGGNSDWVGTNEYEHLNTDSYNGFAEPLVQLTGSSINVLV